MKVCFFNSNMEWGGGELWHLDSARGLLERGHDIVVAAHRRGVLYGRLKEWGIPRRGVVISNSSFLNPLKILTLKDFFAGSDVDAVILNLPADLKAAGIAARLAGVEKIIYRRGIALPVRNTMLNRLLYGRIITRLLVNSKETKRMVLRNNSRLMDSGRIELIYNGIDLSRFGTSEVDPLYRGKNDEIVLGSAGRLTEQKNHRFLLRLAARLRDRGMKFRLLIAGQGELEDELKKYAARLNIIENIVFQGFIEDMRRFMKSIDIFLFPSLWEGFGYALAEAMAAGKPIVAFNTSSNPELVENGVNGYLVDVGAVEAFADKTEILASDGDLREEMGMKGLERVRRDFTRNGMIDRLEAILHDQGDT